MYMVHMESEGEYTCLIIADTFTSKPPFNVGAFTFCTVGFNQ